MQSQLKELEIPLFPDYHMRIVSAVFSIDNQRNIKYHEVANTIRSILQNYPMTEYRFILLPMDTDSLTMMIIYSDKNLDVSSLLAQINIDIETMTGIQTIIGFSMFSKQFSALPELYLQAQESAI